MQERHAEPISPELLAGWRGQGRRGHRRRLPRASSAACRTSTTPGRSPWPSLLARWDCTFETDPGRRAWPRCVPAGRGDSCRISVLLDTATNPCWCRLPGGDRVVVLLLDCAGRTRWATQTTTLAGGTATLPLVCEPAVVRGRLMPVVGIRPIRWPGPSAAEPTDQSVSPLSATNQPAGWEVAQRPGAVAIQPRMGGRLLGPARLGQESDDSDGRAPGIPSHLPSLLESSNPSSRR
jgi:hypothetical protein